MTLQARKSKDGHHDRMLRKRSGREKKLRGLVITSKEKQSGRVGGKSDGGDFSVCWVKKAEGRKKGNGQSQIFFIRRKKAPALGTNIQKAVRPLLACNEGKGKTGHGRLTRKSSFTGPYI